MSVLDSNITIGTVGDNCESVILYCGKYFGQDKYWVDGKKQLDKASSAIRKLELETLTPETILSIVSHYIKPQYVPYLSIKPTRQTISNSYGGRRHSTIGFDIYMNRYNCIVKVLTININSVSEIMLDWWNMTRSRLKSQYPK